jgi:EAL domain-containing protein (putative c-di-GMP-specific phosphodiesterase class I)
VAPTPVKETIAECVENLDSVRTLIELGVEYAQGYALGKPASDLLPGGGTALPLPMVGK